VLPEIPDLRATWTAPFFLAGTELAILSGGVLKVAEGGRITAPKSSARVTRADIYACKVRLAGGGQAGSTYTVY
jgi:hypothetical protein